MMKATTCKEIFCSGKLGVNFLTFFFLKEKKKRDHSKMLILRILLLIGVFFFLMKKQVRQTICYFFLKLSQKQQKETYSLLPPTCRNCCLKWKDVGNVHTRIARRSANWCSLMEGNTVLSELRMLLLFNSASSAGLRIPFTDQLAHTK